MFYETKVLDAYGNLKKIVSTQELHTRHWRIFQQLEERKVFLPKTTFPKKVREKKTKAYWRLTKKNQLVQVYSRIPAKIKAVTPSL